MSEKSVIGESGESHFFVPEPPASIIEDHRDVGIAIWVRIAPRAAAEQKNAVQPFAIVAPDIGNKASNGFFLVECHSTCSF